MDSLTNPYAVAGALLVAACGAIFFLAKLRDAVPKAIQFVGGFADATKRAEHVWGTPERLDRIEESLARLVPEFTNNGGGSLRDRVDATHDLVEKAGAEARQAAMEARLARVMAEATALRLGTDVRAIRDDLAAIDDRVTRMEEPHGDR